MTDPVKKPRQTTTQTWFLTGVIVASLVGNVLFAQFQEQAETLDGVLKHATLIRVGVFILAALIVAAFTYYGVVSNRPEKPTDESK